MLHAGDTLSPWELENDISAEPRFLWTLASSLLFPAARELATGRDGSVQSKGRPTTDSANVGRAVGHWSSIQSRVSCQMSIDIECKTTNVRRTRYVKNEASEHRFVCHIFMSEWIRVK